MSPPRRRRATIRSRQRPGPLRSHAPRRDLAAAASGPPFAAVRIPERRDDDGDVGRIAARVSQMREQWIDQPGMPGLDTAKPHRHAEHPIPANRGEPRLRRRRQGTDRIGGRRRQRQRRAFREQPFRQPIRQSGSDVGSRGRLVQAAAGRQFAGDFRWRKSVLQMAPDHAGGGVERVQLLARLAEQHALGADEVQPRTGRRCRPGRQFRRRASPGRTRSPHRRHRGRGLRAWARRHSGNAT